VVAAAPSQHRASPLVLDVRLLGRFAITAGERSTGPWPRPSARRLCQLVLISPGRRISRDEACEALFPSLRFDAAAHALYKAQSMARSALGELGPQTGGLLCADPAQIWVATDVDLRLDLDAHERALRTALAGSPGLGRDSSLVEALSMEGVPLEDEPEAEWAARVRERVEYLRQEARLELARDRSRGLGRAHPEEVLQAWQACLQADPTEEEAASALMRLYLAQGRRPLAIATYESCCGALARLGLKTSPALEEVRASVNGPAPSLAPTSPLETDNVAVRPGEERRLVSVAFVELLPLGPGAQADPEDLRDLIGAGLAQAISEVEALGGAISSISGPIMSALFGAPQAHEDDPERALRSALRIAAAVGPTPGHDGYGSPKTRGRPAADAVLSVRIGVETGTAIAGPAGSGDQMGYGAVGAVVGTAAALQSAARPGSVLVGPATHAATEGIFEWGPKQDVLLTPGAQPLPATYLVQPKARSVAEAGRRRMAAKAALVGRDAEVALLTESVRATVSGRGGAVVIAGEPGLGKTRLVQECRNYFMGWVGAESGRLPLWLEGRCASYASSTPYGAYQQLLSRFIGAPLEAGEAVVRPTLEAAMRAVLGKDKEPVALLARMLGLPAGPGEAHVARMGPAELQQQTFLAIRSVLISLVSRGPTVLALEDLHWSDPTSLQLTGELATLAASGPLLVLVTRRPEPDPGVGELEAVLAADPARPLRVLALAPIHRTDERVLACSLLGGDVGDDVIEVVCRGVDGNPLFLEERLASLLDTGAIERDGSRWRAGAGKTSHVPEALERLIRSRVDRLSPAARDAIVATSVLGEEAERSAISAVSELGSGLGEGLSELVSAALLAEAGNQPELFYRFRHALIRDATYSGLLRSQRRLLHARAAWHLEANAADRLEDVAAVLGRHFAIAGEPDRAIHYFELAGDNAVQIFANEEAIVSYRQALAVMSEGRGPSEAAQATVTSARSVTAARICEKLADLLLLIDRFGEARLAALDGLAWARPGDVQQAARLHYLLGKMAFQQDQFETTLAEFATAEALIGVPALDGDQEWVDLWLVLQLDEKQTVYGHRNELERLAALIESARPLVEARASAQIVHRFYGSLALMHLRERGWRVDDQIIEEFRRAADAAFTPAPATLTFLRPERSRFSIMAYLGMALTWHGDLVEARRALEESLALAERQGTPGVKGLVLVELAITALREGDVESVRRLLPEARAAAALRGDPYHLAVAAALDAWVAWRDQRFEEAIPLGAEAVQLWPSRPQFRPYCLGLWPLAGAYLESGQIGEALGAARRLLEPSQARLPDDVEAAVLAACEAWERADPEAAAHLLAHAVEIACDLGYA
jgi:class 3 adenylate cyclase/DNA-binding SARP family transcriptional activator/tetratricopeptide (TPR) repeat protein